jgi:membrane protein DedA with SNARE-associated domain
MDELNALLSRHGIAIVFLNVLMTQSGLPVPAVPLLVVAGAFVAQGETALVPLLFAVVTASLIGDSLWYVAGRHFGRRILAALCRVAIEPDSCVKQTENIFERWGPPSLMIAKYIPGFGTIAPPLAGMVRLKVPLFVLYSVIAALLWAGLPIALGFVFEDEVAWVLHGLESMGTGAITLLAAIVFLYVSAKMLERYLLIRLLRTVRISVAELRDLMNAPVAPLVLDVRSTAARRIEPRRLPGAIAVDMDNPQRGLVNVAPDREVVVYCS